MGIFKKKEEQPQPVVIQQKFDGMDGMDDFNNIIGQQDQSAGVELVRELNSPDNILMKSEINSKNGEMFQTMKLMVLSELLDWRELNHVADIQLQSAVSKDRKGRKESVDAVRSIPHEQKQGGFFRRMMGN